MPHMNNLDLAVFPAMSKRHSALLHNYSNKMAPREEIWKTAQTVWRELESASIARGYLLAYRIANKVIEYKGENTFLQKQDFHSAIRSDFYDTEEGCKKRTRVLE
jgi:hypothetical protein